MLKSLVNRIKSEKQSSIAPDKIEKTEEKHQNKQYLNNDYQFKSLDARCLVQCNLNTIRYSVQTSAPKVYNQVLACPISVFNQLPYGKRKVKQIDLRQHAFPQYLNHLKSVLNQQLPTFNHLLINVYPPGIGIMPHYDGPMYRSKVVVLSLGGPAIINFQQNYQNKSQVASLLLEDQSIHIFQGDSYLKYLHGIKQYSIDSIFLKIKKDCTNAKYRVENFNVCNFIQTKLCSLLLDTIDCDQNQSIEKLNIDLSKQYGSSVYLSPIYDNQDFNYKLQLQRNQRISITIREKLFKH